MKLLTDAHAYQATGNLTTECEESNERGKLPNRARKSNKVRIVTIRNQDSLRPGKGMAAHHSADPCESDSDGNADLTSNHEVKDYATVCNNFTLSKRHNQSHTLDRNKSLGNVEIDNFDDESGG